MFRETILDLDANDAMNGEAGVPWEQRLTFNIVLDIPLALGPV